LSASRPPKETIAWTLHFQEPFVNLFLGGDSDDSIVTGRVFAEDVKEMESNRIYADVARPGRELQRSMVSFERGGAFEAVEAFYAKSEQLPARCFNLGDERYAIAFAHPDCDMSWFESLTSSAITNIGDTETVVRAVRDGQRRAAGELAGGGAGRLHHRRERRRRAAFGRRRRAPHGRCHRPGHPRVGQRHPHGRRAHLLRHGRRWPRAGSPEPGQ
jgi:hypothetical protein